MRSARGTEKLPNFNSRDFDLKPVRVEIFADHFVFFNLDLDTRPLAELVPDLEADMRREIVDFDKLTLVQSVARADPVDPGELEGGRRQLPGMLSLRPGAPCLRRPAGHEPLSDPGDRPMNKQRARSRCRQQRLSGSPEQPGRECPLLVAVAEYHLRRASGRPADDQHDGVPSDRPARNHDQWPDLHRRGRSTRPRPDGVYQAGSETARTSGCADRSSAGSPPKVIARAGSSTIPRAAN